MTDAHDVHETRLLDWALGTLAPAEAQRFVRHLESCESCREELRRLRPTVDALTDAAGEATPPPALRARILATVESEASLFDAARRTEDAAEPVPVPPTRTRPRRAALAALALATVAAAVVAIVLAAGGREANRHVIAGSVALDAGGPTARIALVRQGASARLVLTGIAQPPRGRVYQVWLVRRSIEPVLVRSALSRSGNRRWTVRLPPLRDARSVIVTAERPDGAPRPTAPPVALVVVAH